MNKKIALITRYKGSQNKLQKFKNWLLNLAKSKEIKEIYIICEEKDRKILELINKKIKAIPHYNPVSFTVMNYAIKMLPADVDYFIIVSKEVVGFKGKNITRLIKVITNQGRCKKLVVGYRFKITDKKINKELQENYKNESLIAYQVPWNTCAIWDYRLFNEYAGGEFDEITNSDLFSKLEFEIDGVKINTPCQGMEDGLAIARASFNSNNKVYSMLLNKKLEWEIPEDDKIRNRLKLARKEQVLRNFMAVKGYPVGCLEKIVLA